MPATVNSRSFGAGVPFARDGGHEERDGVADGERELLRHHFADDHAVRARHEVGEPALSDRLRDVRDLPFAAPDRCREG